MPKTRDPKIETARRKSDLLRDASFARSYVKATANPSLKAELEKIAEEYETQASLIDGDQD